MAPPNPDCWITDPEYIDLLNYLIKKAESVESPMNRTRLAREFKEKSGAALTVNGLVQRILKVRTQIRSFEHIDKKSKVKLMFALSASIDTGFLKELEKNALVEVDRKKRISYYKEIDGSLELKGDHSHSAKNRTAQLDSKRSLRTLIINYFKRKEDADAVPKNEKEKEIGNFIEFITEKCHNVDTPLKIRGFAINFNNRFGISTSSKTIRSRVKFYCHEIQKGEFLNTHTKVQQLFGLSATLGSNFLTELRKNATVEVDEKNRITHYKATNGSLELRGDHSNSAKIRTAQFESKRSLRSMIIDYFENKNNADAVQKSEEEGEMWNLIEFITEKCGNVNSPQNIRQLSEDFNKHFGLSRRVDCILRRIAAYCHEIQKMESLDTLTKVKQLFCLSASVDSDYLENLRKDAIVEVDHKDRIIKYTANNGHLKLCGDHSLSAKRELGSIGRKKKRNSVKQRFNSGGDETEESENENGYSEDDSDEYSTEEFKRELDSDNEIDYLDETDHMDYSNEVLDFDNETPIRDRSPSEMTIGDNLDFDSPTEKSYRSEETEMGGDEKNDPDIIGNTSVKTRSGRLSKRRHLDSEFSYDLASSRSSEAPASFESASSKSAKQKKIAVEKEQVSSSSNQSRSPSKSIRRSIGRSASPSLSTESEENIKNQDAPRAEDNPSDYPGPRVQGMDDYDYNPREDNTPESISIDNRLGEPEPSAAGDPNLNNDTQNTDNRSNAVAPKIDSKKESLAHQNVTNSTPQTNGKEVISPEVRVKVENEEPIIAEDHTEDVKPVIAHNSKMKFFEAMNSLILFLDTPFLSNPQSKIQQRIRKMKGSKEVLQNNELIPAMELLVARMANHSVINVSGNVESVSLIQFFCYLKASILNSKISGVEGLMNNISGLIEKSQNKRIPMEKVVNALRAMLDIDGF